MYEKLKIRVIYAFLMFYYPRNMKYFNAVCANYSLEGHPTHAGDILAVVSSKF